MTYFCSAVLPYRKLFFFILTRLSGCTLSIWHHGTITLKFLYEFLIIAANVGLFFYPKKYIFHAVDIFLSKMAISNMADIWKISEIF